MQQSQLLVQRQQQILPIIKCGVFMDKYNHAATKELLKIVQKVCNLENVVSSAENVDWRGQKYKSDIVTIEEVKNVGFEVLDNEIIVFYFGDHMHFEDYSSELEADAPDYVERAKEFLENLLTREIRIEKFYKKGELVRDRFYFCPRNEHTAEEEEYIGGNFYKFWTAVFCKKQLKCEVSKWCYNNVNGCFEKRHM